MGNIVSSGTSIKRLMITRLFSFYPKPILDEKFDDEFIVLGEDVSNKNFTGDIKLEKDDDKEDYVMSPVSTLKISIGVPEELDDSESSKLNQPALSFLESKAVSILNKLPDFLEKESCYIRLKVRLTSDYRNVVAAHLLRFGFVNLPQRITFLLTRWQRVRTN